MIEEEYNCLNIYSVIKVQFHYNISFCVEKYFEINIYLEQKL